MLKARHIISVLNDEFERAAAYHEPPLIEFMEPAQPYAGTVQVLQSPYINNFHRHHHTRIIFDSRAMCNMIRLFAACQFSTIHHLQLPISSSG